VRSGQSIGLLEQGTHRLAVGQPHLRFTVTGKIAGSAGYSFGVDAIDSLD